MLPYNRLEAMTDPRIPLADRQWAERCLTAMPVREALAKMPRAAGALLRDALGNLVQPFYFRCSNLDPVTRECTDYHHRPDMCRDYPWYGGEPRMDAHLPPECSFNADIGLVPVALTAKP